MMDNNFESFLNNVTNYYKTNNIKVPSTAVEYLANFPPGCSRQVIKSRFNLTTAEFVKLLTPEYTKPLGAKDRAIVEADRLGYDIVSDLSLLATSRDKVDLVCKQCGNPHTTTITSLQGSKLGCGICKSGNLPWHKRLEELSKLTLDRLDAIVVSEVPSNQQGYVTLRHICGNEYTTQLLGVVSPNSKLRGTCPNCRTTDTRVVVDGITFGSTFESECYLLLKHLSPEIHVEYAKYIPTDRKWVCDFKIGSYWIEVSNFKLDFKGYFNNIKEKENAVEAAGFNFFFVTSLKELEELVSLM